jgi:hypothetical protein
MKSGSARLRTIANTTGFPPDNLEKLLRLRELLTEFRKHPFLRNRLVLKGLTALLNARRSTVLAWTFF